MKAFPLPFATMAVLGMLVCVPAHAGDLSLLNKTQYELSYIYIDTSGADGKGRTGAAHLHCLDARLFLVQKKAVPSQASLLIPVSLRTSLIT